MMSGTEFPGFVPPGTEGGYFLSEGRLTAGVLLRRVVAWVVDLVIIGLIGTCFWLILFTFGLLTLGLAFPLMGLLPLVPLAYHIGFLAGPHSATPGQSALGLTVRRNLDLGRPTLLQAVISTALFYATLATGLVLLAVALFTTRKRALHDLVAGLVVVRRDMLTATSASWNMSGSRRA
jgi:uncharacterized RDD family membrane protein YckC